MLKYTKQKQESSYQSTIIEHMAQFALWASIIELVREIPCYETRRSLFHNRVERGAGEPMGSTATRHVFFIYVM